MNNSLTSSAKELENTFGKVDEKDPKQLLRIIAALISKSKTIIETLDATVARLEKTEKERNYWKNGYLRFRDACQKYIDADGSNNFRHLVELQEELRKLEAEKLMLQEDSRVLAHYNRSEEREDGFLSTKR
jgi:predicted secreted protein